MDRCFDEMAWQLKRDPRFCRLKLSEIDELFRYGRRDLERELEMLLDRLRRRLVGNFESEVGAALLGGENEHAPSECEQARQKVASTWETAAEQARTAMMEASLSDDSEIPE
jgi:hypothetical protein